MAYYAHTKIMQEKFSYVVRESTSAALSRFAESDPFGLPKGRISFSRPRQTEAFNEASRDCIQFKFPYIKNSESIEEINKN